MGNKTFAVSYATFDSISEHNYVLYHFLSMKPISQEVFMALRSSDPQKYTCDFWMGFLSSFQNQELKNTPFEDWLKYNKSIINDIASSCELSLRQTETDVLAYALAFSTYPNVSECISNPAFIPDEKVKEILNFRPVSKIQTWAFCITLKAIFETLNSDKGFEFRTYISIVKALEQYREDFQSICEEIDTYRVNGGKHEQEDIFID